MVRRTSQRRMYLRELGFVIAAICCAACSDPDRQPAWADGDPRPMDPVAQQLLHEGSEALRRHDFSRAFAFVDSAAARAPGLADVPFLRGRILAELVKLDEAEAAYREALSIRPDYPGAWHNLGNTAFRRQQYTEAIQRYRRELQAHTDPRPWRGIARAYVELGMADSARNAFERALDIDSTFAQAHFGLALLLDDLGFPQDALKSARRALRNEPDNTEYRYYVGAYLVKLGRHVEAVEYLQPVIESWPWHHGAHYNMAQALVRSGRAGEAAAVQKRAEELRELQAQISHHENTARVQPNDPYAHAGLGTLLRRAGRYNDAMHAYQVAIHLDPANLEIRNNVAVLHLLRGDTSAAIESFEEIVRADPAYSHAWLNLGSLYALSGSREKARTAWEAALRADPKNEAAHRSLANLPAAP